MANELPIDIIVRSDAAEQKARAFDARLDAIEGSATGANAAIAGMVNQAEKLNTAGGNNRIGAQLGEVSNNATRAAGGLNQAKDAKVRFIREGGDVGQVAKGLDDTATGAERAAVQVGALESRMLAFAAVAGPALAAGLITGIVRQGDEFARLEDRIRRATAATGDYVVVRDELFDVAFATGGAVETQLQLFEAINRSRGELGASTEDINAVTRAISQLGVISGASQVATQNALRQLSQALSADVTRAEEFNSILENTPALAFEIAVGMNTTVGALQAAVREGNVLSKDVFQALLNRSQEVGDEFEKLPIRMNRAFSQVGAVVGETFNFIDQEIGRALGVDRTSGLLAGFLEAMAGGFRVFLNNARAVSEAQNNVNFRLEEARKRVDALQASTDRARGTSRAGLQAQLDAAKAAVKAIETEIASNQRAADVAALKAKIQGEDIAQAQTQIEQDRIRDEALKEREKRERSLFSIRSQLADADERLVLAAERRASIIIDNTDPGSEERARLLQESEDKLNRDREALRLQSHERMLRDEDEFARRLLERDLKRLQDQRDTAEQELALQRENELRRLEGLQEVSSLREAQELADIQHHEDQKFAIQIRSAGQFRGLLIDLKKFEESNAQERASIALGLGAQIAGALASTSKTAFQIQKAFAIAQAVVDGKAAVVGAYKIGASIGGPPVGAAFAAAAGLAVGAQIAGIASTQFNGGAGGSSGSFSAGSIGSSGAGLVIPEAPEVASDTADGVAAVTGPTTIVLQVQGDVFTQDSNEFGERVAPAIAAALRDEISEGDLTLTPARSRNALDLAAGGN